MTKLDNDFLLICFEKLLEGRTLANFEIQRVYRILNDHS